MNLDFSRLIVDFFITLEAKNYIGKLNLHLLCFDGLSGKIVYFLNTMRTYKKVAIKELHCRLNFLLI